MTGFILSSSNPLIAIRDDGVECRIDFPFYQEWLANGGIPTPADTKTPVLAQARELRDRIFSRLNGIQLDYVIAGNNPNGVAAIATAKAGLKEITTISAVLSATTGAEAELAIRGRYAELVDALRAADTYACTAFNGLDF